MSFLSARLSSAALDVLDESDLPRLCPFDCFFFSFRFFPAAPTEVGSARQAIHLTPETTPDAVLPSPSRIIRTTAGGAALQAGDASDVVQSTAFASHPAAYQPIVPLATQSTAAKLPPA